MESQERRVPMRRGVWVVPVLVVGLLLAAGGPRGAWAAGFPEKPIALIVQSSAGGGSDIFARTLAAIVEKEKLLPRVASRCSYETGKPVPLQAKREYIDDEE